jgi:fimbrial isopeptide formation D2 family protein/LPXTG-motif cell wall-anchored protein
MKTYLRKILAVALATLMLLSCLSLASFAAVTGLGSVTETEITGGNENVGDIVDNEEAEVAEEEEEPADTVVEPVRTFELYQIFVGDFSEGVLSNIKWGENAKKPESHDGHGTETVTGDQVCAYVLDQINGVKDASSDSAKLDVITQYVDLTTTPYRDEDNGPTKSDDGYTYTGIAPGYYLIKDGSNSYKKNSDGSDNDNIGAYTLYVVKSSGTSLFFEPKGSTPSVEKKVKEDDSWVDSNSASVGENVSYRIVGTISSRISEFDSYYYSFTDTLAPGLTYDSTSLVVTLYNTKTATSETVTSKFESTATEWNKTNGTTIKVTANDLKTALKDYTLSENSQIIVTYTAKLNQYAKVGTASNDNTVKLTFSNDPNWDSKDATDDQPYGPTGETPDSTVKTYTTSLTVTKKDGAGEKILTGAEFTLSGNGVKQVLVSEVKYTEVEEGVVGTYWELTDGTYTTTNPVGVNVDTSVYKDVNTSYNKETVMTLKGENTSATTVVGTVDDNGVVTFTGLGAGAYTLTETKAPAGYNTADPISFTISFDPTNNAFSVKDRDSIAVSSNLLSTTVLNFAGNSLPHTGGIGTTIFYTIGSIMILAAAVLLIVKKRMGRENS